MNRATFTPALFTRDEAAYYLNCSTRKFNDFIQTGRVTAVRLDGQKLYRREDLDQMVADLPEWESGQ